MSILKKSGIILGLSGFSILLGQQTSTLLNFTVQSVNGSRNSTAVVPVSLAKNSLNVTDPSGLLFSVVVDTNKITVQSATLNPAIQNKKITCKQNTKGYTCIIIEMNQDSIPPGLLCNLTVLIKNGAPLGPAAIMVLNTQAVTPSGITEPAGGGIGIISIK